MSSANSGVSAIGRLLTVVLLLGLFLFGMVGVVYMSLQGNELKVPEITGKDINDGEKELALLGLKLHKKAERTSAEPPGTVIEQLPKPGETVKTGQRIIVVTSKGGGDPAVPDSLKKSDEDDSEKIEEMISDKPKKSRSNSNSNKKKADTARDVEGETANSNSNSSNSNSSETGTDKKEPAKTDNPADKSNRNTQTTSPRLPNPTPKPQGGDAKPKPTIRPGQ